MASISSRAITSANPKCCDGLPVTRRAARRQRCAPRCSDEIDVSEVEAIVASDPSLAFRLLTAVNANAFGLDRRVATLDEAVALLGISKLRCLADLLASSIDAVEDDAIDHSDDVLRGVARADMIASLLDGTDLVRSGVTAALLSVVDRLYDAPLGDLLDELPMSDATVRALLHGTGASARRSTWSEPASDTIKHCSKPSPRVAPTSCSNCTPTPSNARRRTHTSSDGHPDEQRSESPEFT